MNAEQEKWDRIYQNTAQELRPEASYVLSAYDYLLPAQGQAIELACGIGGNALFLAKRGLKTRAWDWSAVAVRRLNQIAREEGLNLRAEMHDLDDVDLPQDFDVIVVTRFLERGLCASLAKALLPGGLLYFQTFVRDKDPAIGPRNPDYLLGQNELLKLFPGLVLRAYCEAGRIGDLSRGLRNEAYLVAQKPESS